MCEGVFRLRNLGDVIADLFRQVAGVDIAFGREDHGALDHVLQFANISRPRIVRPSVPQPPE